MVTSTGTTMMRAQPEAPAIPDRTPRIRAAPDRALSIPEAALVQAPAVLDLPPTIQVEAPVRPEAAPVAAALRHRHTAPAAAAQALPPVLRRAPALRRQTQADIQNRPSTP